MKILMAVTVSSNIYGGPTTVALKQAQALAENGHEVTIITSNLKNFSPLEYYYQDSQVINKGVEIKYFPVKHFFKRKFSLLYSKALLKWLKQNVENYDVFHVHFARELIPVLIAKEILKNRKPLYLQTHGMLNKNTGIRMFIDKFFISRILEKADRVLVLQEIEQKSIKMISPKVDTVILPNGIDLKETDMWNIENLSKKNILFLARLHPRKRVIDFIEMANILESKGGDLNYLIIGPDGGDLNRAKKLVTDYNLNNQIRFIGPIENPEALKRYSKGSIYVLPSIDEPFPMSVLEALLVGIPTIITETTHNRAILEDHDAVLVAKNNPTSLAEKVGYILGNKSVASSLSENGKELIRNKLNIKQVVKELEGIYIKKNN